MTPSPSRLLALATLVAVLACAGALTARASAADAVTLLDRPSGLGALPYDGIGRGNVYAALSTRSLSVDGRYVAFSATADDLVDGDDDGAQHVYRLDRATGAIAQVDRAPDGTQTSYGFRSDQPTISADGRYVAFTTNGTDFGAPKNGSVYVKDLQTGALTLAGVGDDGAPVPNVQVGVLSGDGRHVAFAVQGGAAYLRSLDDGATQKFGSGVRGATTDRLDVAYDGRAVAFASTARLTGDDTDDAPDLYVWRGAAGIVLVSRAETASVEPLSLSDDGAQAAWAAAGRVMTAPVAAGAAVEVSKPQPGGTGGGSMPAFERRSGALPAQRLDFSTTSNLIPGDANKLSDVYSVDLAHAGDPAYTQRLTDAKATFSYWAVTGAGALAVVASGSDLIPGSDGRSTQIWEAQAGAYKLLSIAPGVTRPAEVGGDATLATTHAASDDGTRVALSTTASALGAERSTGTARSYPGSLVVVRDTTTDTTTLVSARPDGTPATGTSDDATIDATGRWVAFRADDDALGAGAGGGAAGYTHGYVRDLATGTTTLVDRAANGAPGVYGIDLLTISADGRHVAFISRSTNLPGATNDNLAHAYVKDLDTGTIELVDRKDGAAGALGDEGVRDVDLNGDGSRVTFSSPAANLGPNKDTSNPQVYLRDRAAATTTWLSVPEDRDPAHVGGANQPTLDRAGDTVAYWVRGAQFGHGIPAEGSHVFVTSVATGATERIAADLADSSTYSYGAPSLSADGRRVGFGAYDPKTLNYQLYVRDRATGTTTRREIDQGQGLLLPGPIAGDGRCSLFRAADVGPLPGAYGPDFNHVYKVCEGAITQAPPPAGGPPPGTGKPPVVWPSPPRDRTAPKVTKAKLSRKRFAVGKLRTATTAMAKRTARPHATTIAFRLSERATITIKIVRVKGAKRIVTLKRAKVKAGNVKINYTGRTKSTVLKPGAHRAEIVATDAAGNRSKTVRLAFTVVSR